MKKSMVGKVIKIGKGIALIELKSEESPCSTCKAQCNAGSCTKAKAYRIWAKNSINADIGSYVYVEQEKNVTAFYSFICFILPLALGFAAYNILKASLKEAICVAAAVATFAVVLTLSVIFSIYHNKKSPSLEIVGKVD